MAPHHRGDTTRNDLVLPVSNLNQNWTAADEDELGARVRASSEWKEFSKLTTHASGIWKTCIIGGLATDIIGLTTGLVYSSNSALAKNDHWSTTFADRIQPLIAHPFFQGSIPWIRMAIQWRLFVAQMTIVVTFSTKGATMMFFLTSAQGGVRVAARHTSPPYPAEIGSQAIPAKILPGQHEMPGRAAVEHPDGSYRGLVLSRRGGRCGNVKGSGAAAKTTSRTAKKERGTSGDVSTSGKAPPRATQKDCV